MQGKRTSLFTFFLTLLAVAALAGRCVAAEHKIIPGDNLNVTVVGEPEYSRTYQVSDDGKVMIPNIGNVVVLGKTAEEAGKTIEKSLALILKKPIVMVDVSSFVKVVGEVNRTRIAVQPDARLSHYAREAVVNRETADLEKGYIVRRGQNDPIKIDLKAVLSPTMDNMDKDILVVAGDTIYVPKKDAEQAIDIKVHIYGEVNTPKSDLNLKTRLTPLQAITTQAGGFRPSADKTRVLVQHEDGSQLTIDLAAVERGDVEPDAKPIYLMDGDTITVPNNEGSKIDVAGLGVTRPGKVNFVAGMTVMEVIQNSGGFAEGANKEEVTITHKSGTSDKVNLFRFLNNGDLSQNVKLAEGDTVFVGTTTASTNEVEVTGPGVKNAGRYAYEPDMRVMNAISAAGGFAPDPSLKKINIVHKDGTSQVVNLEKFLNNGEVKENVPLQRGDMVIVSQKKESTGNKKSILSSAMPILTTLLTWGIYRSVWD